MREIKLFRQVRVDFKLTYFQAEWKSFQVRKITNC